MVETKSIRNTIFIPVDMEPQWYIHLLRKNEIEHQDDRLFSFDSKATSYWSPILKETRPIQKNSKISGDGRRIYS